MREGWQLKEIGEFAKVVGGGTPSTKIEEYWNGDIPWITPNDLSNYNFKFILRGERNITERGLLKSSTKLHPKNTILLTSRAPIGYLAIAGQSLTTNQGFQSIICNENLANPSYIFYCLKVYIDKIKAVASGATFPEVSGKKVSKVKIPLPPLETQRKIAKILSNYDDLIENNLKRIKILEEMAQQTYEEWFVRMRFPGYETATINETTGLPEGWERGTLKRITKYLNGYAFRSALFKDKGNGVIRIKNIGNNTIDLSDVAYIDDEYASKKEKFLLEAGDLLIAMTGATIGKVGIMPESNFKFYLNQRVGKFITKNTAFLNCFFNSVYGNNQVINISGGAAQPNISAQQILDIELTVPSKEILQEFGNLFNNNLRIIINLLSQNQRLREARDILLPRLMMGLLNVDDIDL